MGYEMELGPGVVPNELDYAAAIDAEGGIKGGWGDSGRGRCERWNLE